MIEVRSMKQCLCFFLVFTFATGRPVQDALAQENDLETVSITTASPRHTSGTVSTAMPSSFSADDLIGMAFRQIDNEARRLDRLITNAEIFGKIVAFLALVIVGIISYFGYKSLTDLRQDLQASIEAQVDFALRKEAGRSETFKSLVDELQEAQKCWESIRNTITSIEKYSAITETQYGDPHGAYKEIRTIANKNEPTDEDRRVALTFVKKVIQLGQEGRADPNILFNASSAASELDFDFEAVQLATLCAHWDPKPSHIARKHRLEDVFGIRFVLRNDCLSKDSQTAEVVRQEAWEKVRELVRQKPRSQCELIYSDAYNIASRNRESNYVEILIHEIEMTIEEYPSAVPSYTYAILAELHALCGLEDWRNKYDNAVAAAIKCIQRESPIVTWYEPTLRELRKNAEILGEVEKMNTLLRSIDV